MRTILTTPPFRSYPPQARWDQRGEWPCRWVGLREPTAPPFVAAYRLRFALDRAVTMRLHVTADERYKLYLDGALQGRGPERGDGRCWFFETYDLSLDPGNHLLAARTWELSDYAPVAQFSLRPGFLLWPDDPTYGDRLATGRASWEARQLEGYSFTPPMAAFAIGHKLDFDCQRFPWGFECGSGGEWLPVRSLHPGYSASSYHEVRPHEHTRVPALLPPLLTEPRNLG